jgi:Ca2+/Na+ antiporter
VTLRRLAIGLTLLAWFVAAGTVSLAVGSQALALGSYAGALIALVALVEAVTATASRDGRAAAAHVPRARRAPLDAQAAQVR